MKSEPRWNVEWVDSTAGPITVTQPEDPAQVLLQNPDIYSVPNDDIFDPSCYICVDPEFAAMGLPLCYPCPKCGGHIAADDGDCGACGYSGHEEYMKTKG